MSLLELHNQAASSLSTDTGKFAISVTFRDPDAVDYVVRALVADIATMIDSETQLPVTGQTRSVVVSDAERALVGMARPVGTDESEDVAPWLVEYDSKLWRVFDARPDRTLGLTTCFLELYE